MATATTVRLPKRIPPSFPECCVVCESDTQDSSKIVINSTNPLAIFLLPILFLFGWRLVEFPVCRSCRPKFFFQRWGRSAICWSILILAIGYAMPFFAQWQPTLRRLAVVAIAILTCIPYVIFEVFVPRSFDITAGSSKTDYEFRSQTLALRFYAENLKNHPHAEITLE